MPFTQDFDHATRVVHERLFGEVTLSDLEGVAQGKFKLSPPSEPLKVCDDLRAADFRGLQTADLHRFVDGLRREAERMRLWQVALVAATDLQFGIARLFQSICDPLGTPISVFRSLAEAHAWLGLPPGTDDSQRVG